MYTYRVEKIKLKNGEVFSLKDLTIVVGPNNGGKSQLLKDILSLTTKEPLKNGIVVDSLEYSRPKNYKELSSTYGITPFVNENGDHFLNSLRPTLSGNHSLNVGAAGWEAQVDTWIQGGVNDVFNNYFGSYLVNYLNTEDRLRLIKESPSANVGIAVENILQGYYKAGQDIEIRLRKVIKETFGQDIKLDYSQLINLVFRVGSDLSKIPVDPREARPIFEKLQKLDDQGDGMKSFIATYSSLLIGGKPLLLIDEPEAFLHPPQSIKLGSEIATYSGRGKQILVATHSTEILRGLLSVPRDVSILRIDKSNSSSIQALNLEDIKGIINDPLLSSSRILDGLFYRGTVLTESDSDSTFYQRISRQIADSGDIHFTHAHNKQTTHKAAAPFKKLSIKYAIIVDFDILRERSEFKKLLKSSSMDEAKLNRCLEIQRLIKIEIEATPAKEKLETLIGEVTKISSDGSQQKEKKENEELLLEIRKKLEEAIEQSSAWSEYKKKGLSKLSNGSQNKFRELDSICQVHGIFIVYVGSLSLGSNHTECHTARIRALG